MHSENPDVHNNSFSNIFVVDFFSSTNNHDIQKQITLIKNGFRIRTSADLNLHIKSKLRK